MALFKPCPDEEGIKTSRYSPHRQSSLFKPCPDEEGIKTVLVAPTMRPSDLNLALMKKGLRRK